jgi:hypothetical protein
MPGIARPGAGTSGKKGSMAIGADSPDDGGGEGVLYFANAAVIPTANPAGGVLIYPEGNALKGRGGSGTITTILPAEPHCPRCSLDFALEWRNPESGHALAVCVPCLIDTLSRRGISQDNFVIHRSK